MVRIIIPALGIMAVLTSCSSLRPIQSGNNNQETAAAPAGPDKKKDIKFLDISVDPHAAENNNVTAAPVKHTDKAPVSVSNDLAAGPPIVSSSSIEKASPLQLKYAVLLNMEVELLGSDALLTHIDEWYGTRYRLGGSTKTGIDCSAFVQAIYLSAFGVSLPRTAREQYNTARIISSTELKEGDLVFFNTTGGISHVGIYLQNNKFVHASSSFGVIISDMFEPYYVKRFKGAGRIEKPGAAR